MGERQKPDHRTRGGLSNYHGAQELAKYIEAHFPDKNTQIDIIAHSMGGLIARIYIQTLGGAARVHNLLFLGTPHRGSANVFKTLDQGWGFWKNLAAGGLGSIRETILTFPSVYQLLPSYQNCCGWQNETTGQRLTRRSSGYSERTPNRKKGCPSTIGQYFGTPQAAFFSLPQYSIILSLKSAMGENKSSASRA